MTIPTCDKPLDPKFADFYCNVATWADDSSINQSTDRGILYPPHDSYCISAHFTDKQTGKADWRAAYMGSSEVKMLGQNSVCKDNVFEDDGAIIRSVRICQWSGCNDGNTGDLVTCPGVTQAAAGEASTRSDGRGLLQLVDRNAARATDDARRVLRVLQSMASEASGAVPPSVPVSSSTAAPPAHAAGEASTRSDGRGLLQLVDRNAARATDDARRVLRVLQSIASEASGAVPPSVPVSSSTAAPPAHAPFQAAAGEASTRSDGRGLLQLVDRNAARATDDARRVLRVLQRIASEASGNDGEGDDDTVDDEGDDDKDDLAEEERKMIRMMNLMRTSTAP